MLTLCWALNEVLNQSLTSRCLFFPIAISKQMMRCFPKAWLHPGIRLTASYSLAAWRLALKTSLQSNQSNYNESVRLPKTIHSPNAAPLSPRQREKGAPSPTSSSFYYPMYYFKSPLMTILSWFYLDDNSRAQAKLTCFRTWGSASKGMGWERDYWTFSLCTSCSFLTVRPDQRKMGKKKSLHCDSQELKNDI